MFTSRGSCPCARACMHRPDGHPHWESGAGMATTRPIAPKQGESMGGVDAAGGWIRWSAERRAGGASMAAAGRRGEPSAASPGQTRSSERRRIPPNWREWATSCEESGPRHPTEPSARDRPGSSNRGQPVDSPAHPALTDASACHARMHGRRTPGPRSSRSDDRGRNHGPRSCTTAWPSKVRRQARRREWAESGASRWLVAGRLWIVYSRCAGRVARRRRRCIGRRPMPLLRIDGIDRGLTSPDSPASGVCSPIEGVMLPNADGDPHHTRVRPPPPPPPPPPSLAPPPPHSLP